MRNRIRSIAPWLRRASAVEAAPSNNLSHHALAEALFNRRELQAFRPVSERAIALNRMDSSVTAFQAMLQSLAGDWERGCALANPPSSSIRITPDIIGLVPVLNAYRKREYSAVVNLALKLNSPGFFLITAACTAALGQLGEQQAAQKARQDLAALGLHRRCDPSPRTRKVADTGSRPTSNGRPSQSRP